jgi:hypothetical protein
MKSVKLIVLFILGASIMSFTTKDAANASVIYKATVKPPSVIQWKSETIDVGEIPVGKPYTLEFEFTNTGTCAVIVMDAHASCGCTVANYPKEPILPGKTAKITATYNAANKGAFTKTVTVTIKDETPKVLTFKGTVI